MKNILDLGNIENYIIICGGINGNFEALSVFFNALEESEIDPSHVIHTGDMVGPCGDNEKCIELFRQKGAHSIKGDIDLHIGLRNELADTGYSEAINEAMDIHQWYPAINNHLSEEAKNWLSDLPDHIKFTFLGKNALVVHGGIRRMQTPYFPSADTSILLKEIEASETVDIIFSGHTHIPMMRLPENKLWHNPGSLGLPANDGTSRGWFSILTPYENERIVLDLHPVDFEADVTVSKMKSLEMPESCISWIEHGIFPHSRQLPLKEQAVQGINIESRAFAWPSLDQK